MRALFYKFYLLLWGSLTVACTTAHSNVVFVSSSLGDDTNDGLTEQTPLKTLKAALTRGDTILLKTGDVFYESVKLSHGMLSCYGDLQFPVLSGYKRIVEPRWENVGNNLWRIALANNNYNGFMTNGTSILNNIGCVHEYDKDSIHGRKVQNREDLNEDWDLWQSNHHSSNEVNNSDFDSLYLYLQKNPNSMKLEFSVGCAAVFLSNATISNIRIEGFGFGISAKSHTIIKNCEIDAIGGMIQITDREFVSFGNGIEFWSSDSLSDCVIKNNIITRCYDCACTIQGNKGQPKDITFDNNVIFNCCQGWEDFLSNESEDVRFFNCTFENNIIINSGKTSGFGYPDSRFKYCHVLGNNYKGNKGMIIRNNTFVGGNYYCSGAYQGEYKSNVWQGNTCVIKRGDFILGNYTGTKDVIRIPKDRGEFSSLEEATDDAISRYRKLTGDETTRFIIKDERAINKQIAKLKRKYLKRK